MLVWMSTSLLATAKDYSLACITQIIGTQAESLSLAFKSMIHVLSSTLLMHGEYIDNY